MIAQLKLRNDRTSRFLLVGKFERKTAKSVTKTIGQLQSPLSQSKRKTITPDREMNLLTIVNFQRKIIALVIFLILVPLGKADRTRTQMDY